MSNPLYILDSAGFSKYAYHLHMYYQHKYDWIALMCRFVFASWEGQRKWFAPGGLFNQLIGFSTNYQGVSLVMQMAFFTIL
jgi:hypothetical protein